MDLTRHDTSLKIHIPRQYIHTYSHTYKYTYLCTMCLYKQFSINATVVGVLGGQGGTRFAKWCEDEEEK
jgi:hypothetical protein